MCENHSKPKVEVLSEDSFVNLHLHTAYSLLDGMSRPEDVIKKVKDNRQKGFAVTEHGNVFSAVKMYKMAKENNLKFIYGCEFYICDDRFIKDKNNKYYHLTVLAKNEQGRKNINILSTKGFLEGFYYKPRIDWELLKAHSEGLVVLSGCMASELQQTLAGGKIGDGDISITSGNIERAKEVARRYHKVFGNDYYLEVQSHRDSRQQQLNRSIVDIAKELGIEWVGTADSHFADKDDYELHEIFIAIGQNREAGEAYQDTQIQTEEEARTFLKPGLKDEETDIAIRNTRLILDKCNVNVPLSAPLIPRVDVPEEFNNEEHYLRHMCNKGWKYRGLHKLPKELQQQYKDRLMYEYKAITKMGFTGYYLLVESYANSVERRGIARGSGGGSLIAFLLNIVDIDPIKYGLYFERFIDVGQLDLLEAGQITEKELKIPDFDLDFGTEDRENVVQFIEDRYTKEKFASLGQFGYIWDKSAIKDVSRVLEREGVYKDLTFDVANKITKDLNDLNIQDAREEGYLFKWEKRYPKLFEYAEKLAGLPRSFGVHPCGKCITIDNALDYHALAENDGHLVFQMDMDDAEELGLVKIDALGLRTIDVIYDTLDMIGEGYEYVNPNNMDFADPKVLEIFKNGHTDGVFQFESTGMKSTLKKMKPTGLDDLGVANALYRPGSMKYIDNYIKRKHGEEEFTYLHSDLEPILNVSFGIIVFQEQLIEIGRLAGLRNPDKLRKATGKKIQSLMEEIEPELKEGLKKRGWTQAQVDQLWDDILAFAKYSFNKSHSYAYAIIAYMGAYLKTYHPTEFMTALFNSYEGKHDKLETCHKEAKRLGVKIAPLSYKEPSSLCEINSKGEVVYGLTLIKYCNRQIAKEFDSIKHMKFDYFVELLIHITENMTVNSRQMKALIDLDFFNEFGSKEMLYDIYEVFKNGKGIKYDKKYVEKTKEKRIGLLRDYEDSVDASKYEKISQYQQIMIEQEYYGFIRTTFPKAHKGLCAIIEIDKKYKPKVFLYNFRTGNQYMLKVDKKKFYDSRGMDNLYVGDIIKVKKTSDKPKWKKDGDEWVQVESITEPHLEQVDLIERNVNFD